MFPEVSGADDREQKPAVQDATETTVHPEATPQLPVALPEGADASVRELAFAAQQDAKVQGNPAAEPITAGL